MKKIKLWLPVLTLVIAAIVSCSESDSSDIIWDFVPVEMIVKVHNAAGANLLDADTPGNILGEDISITYNGKNYDLVPTEPGRLWPGRWYGIFLKEDADGESYIYIGEFSGHDGYILCELHIGENVYDLEVKTKYSAKEGVKSREFYINGKLSKGDNPLHTYAITYNPKR
ncbi:MAG: hypothetical protein K2L21_03450 [Muribaculaceae bacterium]|nr:hypothetical protein [Muribaculaceae bacterium]